MKSLRLTLALLGAALAAAALAEPPATGWLTVRTVPPAEVLLDGAPIGVGTIYKHPAAAGAHRLEARAASGKSKRVDITIKRDETLKLTVTLDP